MKKIFALALGLLLLASASWAQSDFLVESTFDVFFTSRRFSTGAPFTLAGTPAVSAYEDNSTTEITAGITLTADFDARTGLNHLRIVATGANGYEAGKSYALVITTGTVDSVSVVGEVIGHFTLSRSASFDRLGAPAGASVSADVAAVKSDTAAILVDTGTTLDDFLDTEIADILADTAVIGTPAGASVSADIAAIEGQTDDIGVAGAGLTAVPAADVVKNAALNDFVFLMVDSTDHVTPETGLTITGTRSCDAAAFAAVSGTIAEIGSGFYQFDALAADTNCNLVTWKFAATGADTYSVQFRTRQ